MEEQVTPSTEHLEEGILDLYVLKAPEVNERRGEIAAHLEHCVGCAKRHQEITEYYAEVNELRKAEAESIFPALQTSSRLVRRPFVDEYGPLSPVRRPVVQRFVSSFKAYPIRWSSAFAVIVAAFVLLVPKLVTTDRNPAYVRAKDEFLIVLNKNGEELWKKYIGPGFDAGVLKVPVSSLTTVVDVDGDEKREIILMPPHPESSSATTLFRSVVCFSADGDERWRFEFHPKVVFDKESFSDDYEFEAPIALGDFDKDGQSEIVFAAHHNTWWPSVVGRLNAKDGTILSEYWHPGWIKVFPEAIDNNAIEEILVAGYNNAFEKSALAVLDSRQAEGHAPATAEYTPESIHESTEMFYALLPNPDLYQSASPWPQGSGVSNDSNGLIEVRSGRILPGVKSGDWVGVAVYFYFDSLLNCVKVKAGDDFINYHSRLKKEGKLTKNLDARYFEELRHGVEYWDGEKFVMGPKMNKKYSSMK